MNMPEGRTLGPNHFRSVAKPVRFWVPAPLKELTMTMHAANIVRKHTPNFRVSRKFTRLVAIVAFASMIVGPSKKRYDSKKQK